MVHLRPHLLPHQLPLLLLGSLPRPHTLAVPMLARDTVLSVTRNGAVEQTARLVLVDMPLRVPLLLLPLWIRKLNLALFVLERWMANADLPSQMAPQ